MKSASNESFCSGSLKNRWAISKGPEGPHNPAFSRLHCVSRKSRLHVRVQDLSLAAHKRSCVKNEGKGGGAPGKAGHSRHQASSHGAAGHLFPALCHVLIFSPARVNTPLRPHFPNEMLYILNGKSISHHQSKQQQQNNFKNRQRT